LLFSLIGGCIIVLGLIVLFIHFNKPRIESPDISQTNQINSRKELKKNYTAERSQSPNIEPKGKTKNENVIELLVGHWDVIYTELGGIEQTADKESGRIMYWAIQKDTISMDNGPITPYRIDAYSQPIALYLGRRGADDFEIALAAVIKIEKDTLTICFAGKDGFLPREFRTSPVEGEPFMLFKLTKVKSK
jgi:uncharacterized protein (TIGR03067 family)